MEKRLLEPLTDDAQHSKADDELGLAPTLVKALHNPFAYAMGLRNGQTLWFESACLSPDGLWVHLLRRESGLMVGGDAQARLPLQLLPVPFERGIDVRISDIVWVADAPWNASA